MNRRHAITILGAASLSSCRRTSPLRTFSTVAFGTDVHFHTHGISETSFDDISEKCTLRLRVIESLFSLYDPDSAIRRLNRNGKLENPHPEFLKLLSTALRFGETTNGIFDITVQPLWDWRQEWKNANLEERRILQGNPWEKALALVDYRNVSADTNAVSFKRTGMAITLNGIVQGYATDEIISLLKRNGVTNALVNIGEYASLGFAPDGKPWTVGIRTNFSTLPPRPLPPGRALAVSAGYGHTFDPEGRFHHIFRPADGENPRPESTVVVTAPTATEADFLATTFIVATNKERITVLRNFPSAELSIL